MISVLACVPTVPGRQPYLVNCAKGYALNTEPLAEAVVGLGPTRARLLQEVEVNFSIVDDAATAGEGWQRCIEQGLEWFPQTTHVHFSNDDIVVGPGWLAPLVSATDSGFVPAMRIEPAGGHIEVDIFQTHPPMPPYETGPIPRDPVAYFFAGLPEEQPAEDRTVIDHANLPFCSVEQWRQIGPFPPIHYGSDRWFAERARASGWPTIAMVGSTAFNYNANIGRHRPPWTEIDFADFDGIFALPAYLAGELQPHEPHPARETGLGLTWVMRWRRLHEGGLPETEGELGELDELVRADAGRFELLRRLRAEQ